MVEPLAVTQHHGLHGTTVSCLGLKARVWPVCLCSGAQIPEQARQQ